MGKKEGYLHPLFKESIPLHTFHVDHLGPLESTNKNYKHILVVIDGFTKFVWLYPTKSTTSAEVISRLEVQKSVFGNPVQIITDAGTAFTSKEFEDYCVKEKIKHHVITTGLPRANGQVERVNAIISSVLTKLVDDPTKWYKKVPDVQRVINSTYQRSINSTPFEVLFGVKMRSETDLQIQEMIELEAVSELRKRQEELREDAKFQILKTQQENKKSYNLRRRPAPQYHVNDLVAIKRIHFQAGSKLQNKYLGPYRVIRCRGKDSYEVKREGFYEGPAKTTTTAEYMKKWLEPYSSSETE